MQNDIQHARTRYRERLTPGLPLLVTIALAGPMIALVFVPIGSTFALIIGAAASLALVAASVLLSPAVRVDGTELRVGRARIDAKWLGETETFTGDEARERRGPGLPGNGWHLIRGGIDGLVVVPLNDPDDPVRTWTISSRTPDRLAAAIEAARRSATTQTRP